MLVWYVKSTCKHKHCKKDNTTAFGDQTRRSTNVCEKERGRGRERERPREMQNNREREPKRVKGTRLADRENSTQYSFYNGKAPTKTTTNGNYSCWNKVAMPWNADGVLFYFFSTFFLFLFVRILFYNKFVILHWMPSQNECINKKSTEISCMFRTSSTKKQLLWAKNNRNVIEDSGNHYNIIRYEVVAGL